MPRSRRLAVIPQQDLVPIDGDTPKEFEPGDHHVEDDGVRATIRLYGEQKACGEYAGTITRLHRIYQAENLKFYGGHLPKDPVITIEPITALGQYRELTGWGGKYHIVIAMNMFFVRHRQCDDTEAYDRGFDLFVDDVLRHEMAHLHCHVIGETERSFHGHGPIFARICNSVGAKLGLGRVKSCRDRSKMNAYIPSCSTWPSCVRPDSYYGPVDESEFARTKKRRREQNSDPDQISMEYLKHVAMHCVPTQVHLELLGQAAIIALRLRYGRHLFPKFSTEIPCIRRGEPVGG